MRTLWVLGLSALVMTGCKGEDDGTVEETGVEGGDSAGADSGGGDSGGGDSDAPQDADGDGVTSETDCDDENAAIFPGADELCDELDNDCDGDIDEDAVNPSTFYADKDGDGYGADDEPLKACAQPEGYVTPSGDCDDDDARFYPSAEESDCSDPNDYNCDGSVGYDDADADGFPACNDCNDKDGAISPDGQEVCDGADNDCDGLKDDGDDSLDVSTTTTAYQDADSDGYGDADFSLQRCATPPGYALVSGDCDEANAAVNPGATEVCDGLDNDCDALADDADDSLDAATASTFYADDDGDSFGDAADTLLACDQPAGSVTDSQDCDDGDAAINPDGVEICDGADNNCDGVTDTDAVDLSTWYDDGDGDGYGDKSASSLSCEAPSGAVSDATDCDDTNGAVNPGAKELCSDKLDNNCDGLTDDSSASDAKTYYADADGDGEGDASVVIKACSRPTGAIGNKRDCDDTDADVYSTAAEVCDDKDNDCDGDIDGDAIDATSWFSDDDGDTFGDPDAETISCDQPAGTVTDDLDCDDVDETVNPDADEVCNGVDDDCDGSADSAADRAYDADGDGVYNCADSTVYSYNYDDGAFTGWTTADLSGSGNTGSWKMSGGYLYEASNAANAVSVGPDMGELESFTVTAEVYANGTATTGAINGCGLTFGYVDASNYWLVRWLDPNDFYNGYTNGGRIDLYRCVSGACTTLATDDGSRSLLRNKTWTDISVSAVGPDITVTFDGVEVLDYEASTSPVGLNKPGVWSYDADSGCYFDNFVVTSP